MRRGLGKRTGGQQVVQAEVPSGPVQLRAEGTSQVGAMVDLISSHPWFLLISTR